MKSSHGASVDVDALEEVEGKDDRPPLVQEHDSRTVLNGQYLVLSVPLCIIFPVPVLRRGVTGSTLLKLFVFCRCPTKSKETQTGIRCLQLFYNSIYGVPSQD